MKYKINVLQALCLPAIATLAIGLSAFTFCRSGSKNKQTVNEYMAAFNVSDHKRILACLTDDVIWEMPGVYRHEGKRQFDKEIENDAFEGRPVIVVSRMVEEADVVVAEGTVKGKRKGGESFKAVFCDVFVMRNGKIKKLTSYLMMTK